MSQSFDADATAPVAPNRADESAAPALRPLNTTGEPLRPVVETQQQLAAAITQLADDGRGPLALDTERAQSYRYSPKAYLVQVRREGAGTWLIDPIALEDGHGPADLSVFSRTFADQDWILHAASQDLPCLAMAQMIPSQVFDTERAARLLGHDRVGLGPLIERYFGLSLRKAHSAADWSRRPLPEDWLVYAALDVELLVELRARIIADLDQAGRREWAEQENQHLVRQFAKAPTPDPERWWRLSNLNTVKSPRGLAVARALWQRREQVAARLDVPAAKVIADAVIVELARPVAARSALPDAKALAARPELARGRGRRFREDWLQAIEQGATMDPAQFPARTRPDPVQSTKSWERHHPEAAARWAVARPGVNAVAALLGITADLVIAPAALRQICFTGFADAEALDALFEQAQVRVWQQELVRPVLIDLQG